MPIGALCRIAQVVNQELQDSHTIWSTSIVIIQAMSRLLYMPTHFLEGILVLDVASMGRIK